MFSDHLIDSFESSITPSDIQHLSLIRCVIDAGRDFLFQEGDMRVTFEILGHLSSVIMPPKCQQYASFDDYFVHTCSSILQDTTGISPECEEKVNNALHNFEIDSIDTLIDFFTNMKDVLNKDMVVEVNAVVAPTVLCSDSYLGLYVRSCLTRWECMSFNNICLLFEELCHFRKPTVALRQQRGEAEIETEHSDENMYKIYKDASIYTIRNTFARPTLSQHNAFSNNDALSALDNLSYNIGQQEDLLSVNVASTIDIHGGVHNSSHVVDPAFHLLNAHKAVLCNDLLVAEESIYRFYDSGNQLRDSNTAQQSSIVSTGMHSNDHFMLLLEKLVATSTSQFTANRVRHQLAMLSLVNMWISDGHSHMALRGIEEAMKIAHQRGDHGAVTESLLLLHMIVVTNRDESVNTDHINAEEVLLRCLKKCTTLNLKSLAVQAALLLAKSRLRRNLVVLKRVSDGVGDTLRSGNNIENLMKLVSVSMYGDLNILNIIVSIDTSTQADSLLELSTIGNTQQQQQQQQQGKVKEDSLDDPLTTREYQYFACQHALIMVDIWLRLGHHELAAIQIQRVLRVLKADKTKNADLVLLVSRFICIQVDLALYTHENGMNDLNGNDSTYDDKRDVTIAKLKQVLTLQKSMESVFNKSVPASMYNPMHFSKLFTIAHLTLIQGAYDTCLRLVLRLIDCVKEGRSTWKEGFSESGVFGKIHGLNNNHETGNNSNNDTSMLLGGNNMYTMSYESAQALVLLARVLHYFDGEQAVQVLEYLQKKAEEEGYEHLVGLVHYWRGHGNFDNNNDLSEHKNIERSYEALLQHYRGQHEYIGTIF